jgi:RNA polymerase sigma-70 factor (ECF subfamily)
MTDDRRRILSMTPGKSAAGTAGMPEDRARALLHRMAEGDEAALGTLYDEWAERVHGVAFWILKDGDDAEDVVEETFWQAWQTASQYDGRRAAGPTWLMMIARSRAIDRLRSRRRRADWIAAPSTSGVLLENASAQHHESPDARPEIAERRAILAAALGDLPPDQRQALELAYFGGLSHAEIAAETAQPLGTVKTRIRLAMQKLQQRLAFLRKGDL